MFDAVKRTSLSLRSLFITQDFFYSYTHFLSNTHTHLSSFFCLRCLLVFDSANVMHGPVSLCFSLSSILFSLSLCLSLSVSIYVSLPLSASLTNRLSQVPAAKLCVQFCHSVCLSVCLPSLCQPVTLSIYLSVL